MKNKEKKNKIIVYCLIVLLAIIFEIRLVILDCFLH